MKTYYEKLFFDRLSYLRGILRDALKDGRINDDLYDEVYEQLHELKQLVINEKWSKSKW